MHPCPLTRVFLLFVSSLIVVACFEVPTLAQVAATASLESKLIEREQRRWAAIKSRDSDQFASYLSSDFLFVSGMGVFTKPQTVKMMAGLSIAEHRLTDFKVLVVNDQTAILAYRASGMASFGGRDPYQFDERHGSAWALREGEWLCVYHHFSPVTKRP